MTLEDFAMTDWDDIEGLTTKDNKEYVGEFRLSKHGFVVCTDHEGKDTRIPVGNIKFTDHK